MFGAHSRSKAARDRGSRSARKSRRPGALHRLLGCEVLEDRRLLSASTWEALQTPPVDDGTPARVGQATPPVADAAAAPAVNTGRLIVRFSDAANSAASADAVRAVGGTIAQTLPLINGVVVNVATVGVDIATVAAQWQALPGVVYAEPDYVYQVETLPNDPQFDQLWGLQNTGQSSGTAGVDSNAVAAWANTTGSSQIVVADIDTGIDYNHPDLAANVWTNPGEIAGDGIDNDHNGYIDDVYGIDTVNGDCDPMDDHGHGTHTAGTIGAVGDNGVGVVGVNWNVKIMGLKFLDAGGSGSTSGAIAALQYMTMMKTQYGINIVASNNSWGGGGYSQALYDAIQASNDAGIMFVAAAGNSNVDADAAPQYPAAYDLPGIISVGAIDRTAARAWFSNYGATTVDLAAPGVAILSTTPNNTYASYNGTSMATPHVTGAVALAVAYAGDVGLDAVKTAILNSAVFTASFAGKCVTGGRLNIAGMLDQLHLGVVASTPAQLSVQTTRPTQFTLQFNHAIDPASVAATDFTVNGIVADQVTIDDGVTLTFRFNTSPVANQGRQTMAIAAGAIERLDDHSTCGNWTGAFYYDVLSTQVVSMQPADGGIAAPPLTAIRFDFNEAMDWSSFERADLQLSRGLFSYASWIDADTVDCIVSGLGAEGAVDVQLLAGSLRDVYGNSVGGYSGTFYLDYAAEVFPTLQPVLPEGSLIQQQSLAREISYSADVDRFSVTLGAGELLSVVLDPATTLRGTVEVWGPAGGLLASAAASTAGQGLIVQTLPIATTGTYTVRVSGDGATTGGYQLQLVLNAAIEAERFDGVTNDTPATAADLGGSLLTLPGTTARRGAVLGSQRLPLQPTVSVVSGAVNQMFGTLDSIVDGVGSPRGSNSYWGLRWFDLQTVLQIDLGRSVALTGLSLNADADDQFLIEYYDSGASTWRTLWNVPSYQAIVTGLVSRPDYGYTENERFHALGTTIVTDKLRLAAVSGSNAQFTVNELELQLAPDVYRLPLAAGETASLALQSANYSYLTLEVIDAQGQVLASGQSATNTQQIVSQFTAPTGGVYYARVSGLGDYTLVTMTNGQFESEPNAAAATPTQNSATFLGAISLGAGEHSSRPRPLGQETYRLDGAVHEYASGFSPLDNLWLNQFSTTAGAEVIDSISLNFGPSLFVGTPASVVVMSDPNGDGDPHDAVLLSETAVEVAGSGFTEGWITVPITPTRVSGSFFVGALVRDNWEWGTPILYDVATPDLHRSWIVLADAYSMNLANMAALFDFRLMGGNAAIRANAAAAGDVDRYTLQVAAGEHYTLSTTTPFGTGAAARDLLDPIVEVYDAQGQLVARDNNSAADGRNALLSFTAAQSGTYTIQVSAAATTGAYVLNATRGYSAIAGRRLFYNNSAFDGRSAAADATDDGAIVAGVSALLPGQWPLGTFATSASKGINGVMIDVAGLPGTETLTAADFSFKVGSTSNPANWTTLATAPSVSIRRGAGVGGADRVSLTWADGTLTNTWLEVTVRATAATGLAAADRFYFGNSVGDVTGDGIATFDDMFAVYQHVGQPVATPSFYDVDGDGAIGFSDVLAVSQQISLSARLSALSGPALGATGAIAVLGPGRSAALRDTEQAAFNAYWTSSLGGSAAPSSNRVALSGPATDEPPASTATPVAPPQDNAARQRQALNLLALDYAFRSVDQWSACSPNSWANDPLEGKRRGAALTV